MESLNYPLQYNRQKTRIVNIGRISIGGDNPICIQSMLTSATRNIPRCISEIKSLADVCCELIRLTIPTRKDLDAIPEIRRIMREEGIEIPLVADIHFSPKLAVEACELFEKIRINPGNYSDTPRNSRKTSGDNFFEEGYLKLKESIQPLVKNLLKYNRALRIGVNQGSLSVRMMERYGDSPQGMVQSALEMITLFEEQGFEQIVVSLKSSNPIVVQKAYRLLKVKQKAENAVALHLGVTEAGNGIMGRIKSLTGIAVLLADGIGDTIRVSLTEPSTNEIIFARKLLKEIFPEQPSEMKKSEVWKRPLDHRGVVNRLLNLGTLKIGNGEALKIGQLEGTILPATDVSFDSDFTYRIEKTGIRLNQQEEPVLVLSDEQSMRDLDDTGYSALIIDVDNPLFFLRKHYNSFKDKRSLPVGIVYPVFSDERDHYKESQIAGLLSEGLIDFLLIPAEITGDQLIRLLFLLQATRRKIVVTDYIICPSCGRTLFDIETISAKIKERTKHLKGLKIGIMGCIVNGPGEMADADFGYVGSGAGKVDLYFGRERVCRGINEEDAVDSLIQLIKDKGRWR
ncbi:(E)-4-hydroxy-3-methylbut-2-enyl-diphosphate synthase [bacterium]|nr:(E)-4-hydroxy-3-methylbut-2-enyl-diphosphate synthase [bacterium]